MAKQLEKIVYVIDDDDVMRLSCQQILERLDYQVETFEDGAKGLARVEIKQPDLIVVDLKMPKISGLDVIKRTHELNPEIVIIVITGYATIDTAVDAMKAGAYDFLPKPFTPDEFRLIVKRAMEKRQLVKESTLLRQEKDKMQRQFITFVSHQLQSPLVAIQQYCDVLKQLDDTPEKAQLQQQWIERSSAKMKELLDLIKDWLTISRIERGCLADKVQKVNIVPLISKIIETYENRAAENNLKISFLPDQPSYLVHGCDECLGVVFSNLYVNAIKYNRLNGSITISIEEDEDHTKISFTDTGLGISETELPKLFEEFYRIKTASTQNIPGTGLGLAICKKIIQELDGKIEVQSKLDYGTIFQIIFPKCKD
jgi:two-component system, sensor histidine kinase and response regulator